MAGGVSGEVAARVRLSLMHSLARTAFAMR